jgi:hypothetical protein|tara:strand:+ start:1267 stop:1827 length:561 start_codon:yes stop_codon:yes gene_type:complete
MYGTNVESNSTGGVMPAVGIQENCELVSVTMNTDKGGRLDFEFKQSNGATVKHAEFPANPDFGDVEKQATDVSRRVKHIATKIMDEAMFTIDNVSSFEDYGNKVIALFGKKYEGIKFRMLFIYKGKYVSLPKFPNFIENMSITADKTNIYISDWNKKKLIKPEPDTTASSVETVTSMAAGGAEMPF